MIKEIYRIKSKEYLNELKNITKLEELADNLHGMAEGCYSNLIPYLNHYLDQFKRLKLSILKDLYPDSAVDNNEHIYGLLYNLTTNTLSLAKNIILGLEDSPSNFTLIRAIVENGLTLKIFTEKDIDSKYIKLFKHHYCLFDYQFEVQYHQKIYGQKISDGVDRSKRKAVRIFKDLFDLETDEEAQRIYSNRHGWAYKLVNDKPFISFKDIIDFYGDEFEKSAYDLMSSLVHPHLQDIPLVSSWVQNTLLYAQRIIYKVSEKLGAKFEVAKENLFVSEYQKIIDHPNSVLHQIEEMYEKQVNLLSEMQFLVNQGRVNQYHDVLLRKLKNFYIDSYADYALGFNEVLRAKFKLMIEELAFNRYMYYRYFYEKDRFRLEIIRQHYELRRLEKIDLEKFHVKVKEFKKKYEEVYKKKISMKKFINNYIHQSYGFNINEKGNYTSITKFIGDQVNQLFEKNKRIGDDIIALFEEVNSLGHASMYQYYSDYSNQSDAIMTTVNLIDISTYHILEFLMLEYFIFGESDEDEILKNIFRKIETRLKQFNQLSKDKIDLIKTTHSIIIH